LVVEGLAVMRRQFPMPIRGIDTDNDGAFINETLQNYCREQDLSVTVRVGTTLSGRCEPDRNRWISAKWPPLEWLGSRMDRP
jgi:hypothetical protein